MKERPILFSGPMVNATLEGSKTQTRRTTGLDEINKHPDDWARPVFDDGKWVFTAEHGPAKQVRLKCRYGMLGDKLWIRETCRAHELSEHDDSEWLAEYSIQNGYEKPPFGLDGVVYRADGSFREIKNSLESSEAWQKLYSYRRPLESVCAEKFKSSWVPAIHMPHWASRQTLSVTGIRLERLRDISEADAVAEGARYFADIPVMYSYWDKNDAPRWRMGSVSESTADCLATARFAFANYFIKLNGIGIWEINPWVWVIQFERAK